MLRGWVNGVRDARPRQAMDMPSADVQGTPEHRDQMCISTFRQAQVTPDRSRMRDRGSSSLIKGIDTTFNLTDHVLQPLHRDFRHLSSRPRTTQRNITFRPRYHSMDDAQEGIDDVSSLCIRMYPAAKRKMLTHFSMFPRHSKDLVPKGTFTSKTQFSPRDSHP